MTDRDTRQAVNVSGVSFAWPRRSGFSLDINAFTIETGETVFLFGESGSGKSTLLSLICGILTPQEGSIQVDGVELTTLSPARRDRLRADRIGVIFQMFNLLPYATPIENVLLALNFSTERRTKLSDPRLAAANLLGDLGLSGDHIERAPASELSVGQQQRVAVARALIGSPTLVVADEPTSALDASNQAGFIDLLFEQTKAAGSTLLMVSHDERIADRFDRVERLSELAQTNRSTSS